MHVWVVTDLDVIVFVMAAWLFSNCYVQRCCSDIGCLQSYIEKYCDLLRFR